MIKRLISISCQCLILSLFKLIGRCNILVYKKITIRFCNIKYLKLWFMKMYFLQRIVYWPIWQFAAQIMAALSYSPLQMYAQNSHMLGLSSLHCLLLMTKIAIMLMVSTFYFQCQWHTCTLASQNLSVH